MENLSFQAIHKTLNRMKQYNIVIVSLIVSLILTSCASPKTDGEKLAREKCEAWNEYVQNTITAYNNFVKEFGSKDYQTRTQARDELNTRIDEVESQLASQLAELESKYSALYDKYKKDHANLQALSLAYNNSISTYKMDTTQFAGLRRQANAKILTIIPPMPEAEKLQKDLIGRRIKALPGGYLNNFWTWTIERGDIKNLQIVNLDEVDKFHKEYVVDMTLQRDGATYKTNSKIYYVLDNRDDWEIDMLEPSEVEVVRTGRYDSSIISSLVKPLFGEYVSFQNVSDAALLVGYRILDNYGRYTKHSLLVGGGETKTHSGLGITDYSIDFVERP